MTTRTIQIYGYGFGPTPADITVVSNGSTVFSGTITTVDQPVPTLPNLSLVADPVVITSFDIPVDFTGLLSMSCQVNNGTVLFCQITENYNQIQNPVYTPADWAIINNPSSNPINNVFWIITR